MSDSCVAAFVKRYAPTAGAQIWNAFESGWSARVELETESIDAIADKIITDWLAELGKDEHVVDWDDLADLKNRIAKALKGNV